MEPVKITKGTAPTHRFTLLQNGSVLDISGGGVSATLKMEKIDAPTTKFSATGTGLNSSGWCYFTFTTTATATIGEYAADIIVAGLTAGSCGPESPFVVIIRDDKGA